jgi:CBS domain-containing protein
MNAKELMTEKVVTARPQMTVAETREMILAYHVSGLPVVDDDGQVLGIVSERDLLARDGRTAGDIMTSPAITVADDASAASVASVLAANAINRVPVVREKRLVGIVSRADIIRYVAARPSVWAEGDE